MNKNRVPTTFGPETRFAVNPAPAAPFRAVLEDEFERLNYLIRVMDSVVLEDAAAKSKS